MRIVIFLMLTVGLLSISCFFGGDDEETVEAEETSEEQESDDSEADEEDGDADEDDSDVQSHQDSQGVASIEESPEQSPSGEVPPPQTASASPSEKSRGSKKPVASD